jgi:hypothetical protein
MNRLTRLSCVLITSLLTACANPVTPAPLAPTTAPSLPTQVPLPTPGELFFARPEGSGNTGPLVAYDTASGAEYFTLPAGLLSADREHYFTAQPGPTTQLTEYNLNTGVEKASFQIPERWELSGLSPSGHQAALTRPFDKTGTTAILVVDTQTGQTTQRLELNGNFEVDALSAAGNTLFLIEYLPALNPDHYQVRAYDLAFESLVEGALVDKRAPDEVMAGQRQDAVTARDGSWVYTLYLRTRNNTAFIHALNTVDRYTLCIDLPANGTGWDSLLGYTLAVGPDGQTVLAANPVMGVVAKVNILEAGITQMTWFSPLTSDEPLTSLSPSVMSVDGKRVYFADQQTVWGYDLASEKITGPYAANPTSDAPIISLGLSSDGSRLYVAQAHQPLIILEAATGQRLTPPGTAGQ